ncbi:MAG: hypothetical protein RSE23_01795 [Clostridia bacterium]
MSTKPVSMVAEVYKNPSMPLCIILPTGERRNVAHASANLRGNRGMSINIDVSDHELCADNLPAITNAVMGFIDDVFTQAQADGVPVRAYTTTGA